VAFRWSVCISWKGWHGTGPKRSAAEIHRQVSAVAAQKGWPALSYGRVYDIIQSIDPELMVLAKA
jgi:hypothetical protein